MALRKKRKNHKPLPVSAVHIRFKHGDLAALRARLLEDLSRETFAVLFGKLHRVGSTSIITVRDWWPPTNDDYNERSIAFLNIDRGFIYDALREVTSRLDVDTIIDTHTHPFAERGVGFSHVDDSDERRFSKFLTDTFDTVNYASIVFSQTSYSARLWHSGNGRAHPVNASIGTQTPGEQIAPSHVPVAASDAPEAMFSRGAAALGVDVLRAFASDQRIAVVGVGGLGSIIAEHLIHMGFRSVVLIDPDRIEVSNLNRIVGATYTDAISGRLKVDAIRDHLLRINPRAEVIACAADVRSDDATGLLATATWILLATDNHTSRQHVQHLALRLFVPIISAGVNISVEDGRVTDMSGEVITIRAGDKLCLRCLGRVDPTRMAFEENRDTAIGDQLVAGGYIVGADVPEPAVKTLNSHIAALAVDVLVNHFTERVDHTPILVFDGTNRPAIYADEDSVVLRQKHCFDCDF
jgi:molybdopterin/thiamine biosynthesis adenylyltransferase